MENVSPLGNVEPIAVVGLGCRFPGAPSPAAFWELLREGRSAVREVPDSRWDTRQWYDPELSDPRKANTKWGGFLEDLEGFDPRFFGLSVSEAAEMDPQQRLVLEVAWEALEDAGIPPEGLAGTEAGVFLGLCSWDFSRLLQEAPRRGATGVALSIVANRLSYLLDLHGPSLVVDTACSSSLVSVDLACQSLRAGSSSLALAGGVNVILSPRLSVAFSQAGMMAPDGRCKTFDAQANGYVRGEGCGILVLRRLSSALQDGNRIRALIRGSAVNHNGRSNGLTAPHPQAQRQAITRALQQAGLEPARIGYIEAHGSGTALGDVIEVQALAAALGETRPAGRRCLLGSVKTNIGHLESAAGVAGLIKTILALQHGAVPAHLNLETLNPRLGAALERFEIPRRLTEWPRGEAPRAAGVSSFGFGGANAHLVLEEAPPREPLALAEQPCQLFTLSARSWPAVRAYCERYLEWLAREEPPSLAELCHAANTTRSQFSHRAALIAADGRELAERLQTLWEFSARLATEEASLAARGLAPDAAGDPSDSGRLARGVWAATVRPSASRRMLAGLPGAKGALPAWPAWLVSLAEQFTSGLRLDWRAVTGVQGQTDLDLPTYPFQRVRCWPEEARG